MRYKHVIFDLDGVLVFTDEYHYKAWKTIADRLEIPFDETVNNRLRGVSRMESLEIILSYSGKQFSDTEKEAMAAEKNKIYKDYLENLSPQSVSGDTIKMLDALQAMGVGLAIGSSSKNAEFILQKTGIAHYFKAVASGNNITKTKPDPEVFLLAADLLGAEPEDCLVVEDAHAGAEAAHRGGFDCAGMGDAYTSELVTYRIKEIGEISDIAKQGRD